MNHLLQRILRGLRMPPGVIWDRICREARSGGGRYLVRYQKPFMGRRALLRKTGARDLNSLWERLGNRPYPFFTEEGALTGATFDSILGSGERERILAAAEAALAHRVDLLGSGPVSLGNPIDWVKDYKSDICWPLDYSADIDYNNPDQPSDVKFPWEVSRMQWLIPVGQAYLLTGDEKYSVCVREILEDWFQANPYHYGVNWACTMEVALRILTWTWFFRVFWRSQAWSDPGFRERFLGVLYYHGAFTASYLERSDINGNHYTADAAGLVFGGLFFGRGREPASWLKTGWRILTEELPRQVYADGVDFEASMPYHRLVLELLLFPALYREACELEVPESYRERVRAMANFTAAYSRPDGSLPLWGDADDARAIPFRRFSINDHRYLIGLVGLAWDFPELTIAFTGPMAEIFWTFGLEAVQRLRAGLNHPSDTNHPSGLNHPSGIDIQAPKSRAFPVGGFYIMRNERDHVFIDCGPVGLGGRGGHGHNDCLSFEAFLEGVWLIADCGAYLYTASYSERNQFRSTAYHNTPQIDGEEQNRFLGPEYLWSLHYEAIPEVKHWETNTHEDRFVGSHAGYRRLSQPVIPERTIILDHRRSVLTIEDRFQGEGEHEIAIPLHLAPGVEVRPGEPGNFRLTAQGRQFILGWSETGDWEVTQEPARISPSYGIVLAGAKLLWRRRGILDKPLIVTLNPADIK